MAALSSQIQNLIKFFGILQKRNKQNPILLKEFSDIVHLTLLWVWHFTTTFDGCLIKKYE